MSYMEQTCPHSGAFGYRAPKKGRNLSWFVEIALGALVLFGIFAGIVMIGGCLGCEACFECAAACDEEMGCGLEECARDCNAQSDDCVSCEGIDCFGREGCFACDGKWDCSDCSGEVYYKVELNTGDQTQTLKFKAGTSDISIGSGYNEDRPREYFTFKGYYNKKIGGDKYIDESGNVVKKITKDIKLYAQYDEVNQGELYEISFVTTNSATGNPFFPAPHDKPFGVGEPSTEFPEYAELDDYVFKGWYTAPNGNGKLIYGPEDYEEMNEFTLHLSDFGKNPNDGTHRLTVYAHYTYLQYDVKFHYVNGSTKTVAVDSGTTFGDVLIMNNIGSSGSDYTYFGWSYLQNDPNPDNTIADTVQITMPMDVYELSRKNYTFTFEYRVTTTGTSFKTETVKITSYEGATLTFDEQSKLLDIKNSTSLYKGYSCTSWVDEYGRAATSVYVSSTAITTYKAEYKEDTYKITYVMYRSNGSERDITDRADSDTTEYKYSETNKALWICPDDAELGEFLGWCEKPDLSDTPRKTLPTGAYGHKKLYAKFRNS